MNLTDRFIPTFSLIIFISFFFSFSGVSSNRNAVLSLGNVSICSSEHVLIPLMGENLVNIGAITLFLNYDETRLEFVALENIDPQISGLFYNVLSNPSRISIVWSNTKGVNFSDKLLLNLRFNVLMPVGYISFAVDSCEVADAGIPPEILSVNYFNGSVTPGNPIINEQPTDLKIVELSNAIFNTESVNASGFQWQETSDNAVTWRNLTDGIRYSGTGSSVLTLNLVPVTFNNYKYRCSVYRGNCQLYSDFATLSVDSVNGILPILSGNLSLSVKPNPFCNDLKLSYFVPETGEVTIEVYSNLGKKSSVIKGTHFKDQYIIDLNFVYLPIGFYYVRYVFANKKDIFVSFVKIVKSCQ